MSLFQMTTQEKLQRIKSRCQELLAIAEKRTQGKWKARNFSVLLEESEYLSVLNNWTFASEDASFIASCAGSAEAGWRATIAAINDWQSLYEDMDMCADGAPDASAHDKLCLELSDTARINLNKIIATWEGLL